MTLATPDAGDLLDKSIKKVWIKDGKRKMMTDTGYMNVSSDIARRLFGRLKGGKYSERQ